MPTADKFECELRQIVAAGWTVSFTLGDDGTFIAHAMTDGPEAEHLIAEGPTPSKPVSNLAAKLFKGS